MSAAGTLEARYADVVLRLGQTKAETAAPGVPAQQRAQALAFEYRWQGATLLLLRALELRLRQGTSSGGPAATTSDILPAPTFLVPMQGDQVVRTPWTLLEAYRMPRVGTTGVPRGCEALTACVESVATFGNQALGLASQAPVPEVSLGAAYAGLARALERTQGASELLHLRLGPLTDSTDWVASGQERPLAARWRTADSLERALLTESGASPSEVASYADWITQEPLTLACVDCTTPAFWQAAREVLRAHLSSGNATSRATGTEARPSAPPLSGAPGGHCDQSRVEWFDAMGRKVWSGPEPLRVGPNRNDSEWRLPRGIYFIRDSRWGSLRTRRVVVFD